MPYFGANGIPDLDSIIFLLVPNSAYTLNFTFTHLQVWEED